MPLRSAQSTLMIRRPLHKGMCLTRLMGCPRSVRSPPRGADTDAASSQTSQQTVAVSSLEVASLRKRASASLESLPSVQALKSLPPTQFQETHVSGTSPAAALISRQAARLHDIVEGITGGTAITRRQKAAAIKALLVHGTSLPERSEHDPLLGTVAFGNGLVTRDFSEGCATNEAVVLYVGSIAANEEQELLFPLPNGLSVREAKRIDATLAWLTPVNWRHRQYRKASLAMVKPAGSIPLLDKSTGISSDESTRGASTVQHQTWEFEKAFASGQGSNMSVRLKCYEQAGGLLGERVDFAIALSLWVAPSLGVDIYSQVKAQVEARVAVRP